MAQRRMADLQFRRDQWNRRFDSHVTPVNELVDMFRRERGLQMPYVAPLYGGTRAEVLFIFQDPGPGTNAASNGSGFLCPQNDDPTAEVFANCLDSCGLDVGRTLGWNAYPWYLPDGQKRPNARQLEEGVEPTRRLLELLHCLGAVVLMGRVAEDGWRRLAHRHPGIAEQYFVVGSPHPSRRGLIGGGMPRAQGIARVEQAIRAASEAIA